MTLFSYKDVIIGAAALGIMRGYKYTLEETLEMSPAFENLPNLEAAIEFLDRRAHVYTRLTAAEEMFSKILNIQSDDHNYFPEELPVFAEASPDLAEHHQHFFDFWKAQTLHRGFHDYIESMVKLIDGQHYQKFNEAITDDDFQCIGFPGMPNMLPGVQGLIDTYDTTMALLGFDPSHSSIAGYKSGSSQCLYCDFNTNTRLLEPSVMTLCGRIYLNSRPDNKVQLGGKFIKMVK